MHYESTRLYRGNCIERGGIKAIASGSKGQSPFTWEGLVEPGGRDALNMEDMEGAGAIEAAKDIESGNENEGCEGDNDDSDVAATRVCLIEPGTFTDTETAEFHSIDNVLGTDNGADDERNDEGREASDFPEDTAAKFIKLEATCALSIECRTEIATNAREETEREIHRVGDPIGQAKTLKAGRDMSRVGGIGERNGDESDSEVA